MTLSRFQSRWRHFVAVASIAMLPAPAIAQADTLVDRNEAGRALSQHLNTLSMDTRNVRALVGAGEAALALDDPNGAIGFFGRADEIDPRNGRVKAGLGRVLLVLEKPREALRLFEQAVSLGLPEAEVARDRGLAYDLRGDQKRAQRDYAIALRNGADPETTRRMALSFAISGDKDQALKLLDPLLYKQDKAAWRARAFILAMTGDVDGANKIARQVMPGNLARPMAPFFARLPALVPAQKAAAVHYGHMSADPAAPAPVYAYNDSTDTALVPAPSAAPRPSDMPAERVSAPVPAEPRRRPGSEARATQGPRLASVAAAQALSAPEPVPTPRASSGRIETRLNTRIGPLPAQPPTPEAPVKVVLVAATELPPPSGAPAADPPASVEIVGPPAQQPSETTTSGPVTTADSASLPGSIASHALTPAASNTLAAIIGALELEAPVIVAPPTPAPRKRLADAAPIAEDKKAADKKLADKKAAEKKAAKPDPKKTEPARIWAQVLTGADRAALGRDYRKMTQKSVAAFKGKAAWTAPYKGTRRLLVGPFDSQKKAQEFLDKAKVQGFVWSSAAGEAVEKLGQK